MDKITTRGRRHAPRTIGAIAFVFVAAPFLRDPASAQTVDLDFTVEQAVTSIPSMASPTGYRVGLVFPRVMGPVGIGVAYRSVSEYLGERPARCGMDACVPGPFDAVMHMRGATLGLSASRTLGPFVELSAGGTASLTWQASEYGPADDAAPEAGGISETVGPDPGLGVFASWRFPPVLSILRPVLAARAEWVAGGRCRADAACFGSRYLAAVSIGMHARIP